VTTDGASGTSALHSAPEPFQLRETLEMMLGRQVAVSTAGQVPPEGAIPAAVGGYIDDDDELRGCAWIDLPLAAAMGAALSMVPREQVDACLESGVLPEEFQGNLHETLSVASALLNDQGAPAVHSRPLELLEAGLSQEVLDLLADPRAGGYYTVDIEEYGSGLLSFTLA
jgi:hypothetical protein